MNTNNLAHLLCESDMLRKVVNYTRATARKEGMFGYYVTCTEVPSNYSGQHFFVLPHTIFDTSVTLIRMPAMVDPTFVKKDFNDTITVLRHELQEKFLPGWYSTTELAVILKAIRVIPGIGVWDARTIAGNKRIKIGKNLEELLDDMQLEGFEYLAYMHMSTEKIMRIKNP